MRKLHRRLWMRSPLYVMLSFTVQVVSPNFQTGYARYLYRAIAGAVSGSVSRTNHEAYTKRTDIETEIMRLPTKVIADHQGGMKGTSALPSGVKDVSQQPGLESLLRLAKTGKVYIKISGFYRSSHVTTDGYEDLEPLIKIFAREVPQQLIWGSDWPHTGSGAYRTKATKDIPESFREVNNAAILMNIKEWVGLAVWRKMSVETPGRLFD